MSDYETAPQQALTTKPTLDLGGGPSPKQITLTDHTMRADTKGDAATQPRECILASLRYITAALAQQAHYLTQTATSTPEDVMQAQASAVESHADGIKLVADIERLNSHLGTFGQTAVNDPDLQSAFRQLDGARGAFRRASSLARRAFPNAKFDYSTLDTSVSKALEVAKVEGTAEVPAEARGDVLGDAIRTNLEGARTRAKQFVTTPEVRAHYDYAVAMADEAAGLLDHSSKAKSHKALVESFSQQAAVADPIAKAKQLSTLAARMKARVGAA